jgi:sugar phosphate isomerase/epimerase
MVGAPDLRAETLAPFSGDLATAFEKLARLGYDGIELMARDPGVLDGSKIRGWLEESQLGFVGVCTGHVFFEDGLGLIGPGPHVSHHAVARLKELIDLAAAISPQDALVNIGRARGMGEPRNLERTRQVAEEVFRELATYAEPRGVRIALEPLSSKEASFVLSTDEGIQMVERVNSASFGLLMDVYHMNLTDRSITEAFRRAGPRCWHVHVSDANRQSPAPGTFDYQAIIGVLVENGYSGYLTTEIQPWPNPDAAARASIRFLRKYVPSAGDKFVPAKGVGHGR